MRIVLLSAGNPDGGCTKDEDIEDSAEGGL